MQLHQWLMQRGKSNGFSNRLSHVAHKAFFLEGGPFKLMMLFLVSVENQV